MGPSRRPSAVGVVAGAIMTVTACECRYAVDGAPEPDAGDTGPVVAFAADPGPDPASSHLLLVDAGSLTEELDGGASVASPPGPVAGVNDAGIAGAPPQGRDGGDGDGHDEDCDHGNGHGHGHGHGHGRGDDQGCGDDHQRGLKDADAPDAGDEIGVWTSSWPPRPAAPAG